VAKAEVRGAEAGPLSGRTIVLKDNVALAGVPMAGGTDFLADYIPPCDATVVTRILDAGGTIVGKAQCEYLSASAGSHTGAGGFVHNPHRHGHSAGGSSSGSAALVAAGEVDLAIGGDQGGSIRIPSSLCGTVGMKPTFGLVPYTGILPIEATIDHTGPITANVSDNARFLEVLAGPDGIDPRQMGCQTQRYSEALGRGVEGLRIALVEEGFSGDRPAAPVVRAAAERLRARGAKVETISIPEQATHSVVLLAFFTIGATDTLMADGAPSQLAGLGLPGLTDAFSRWRLHPERIPAMATSWALAGIAAERHGPRGIYAKAQNLRRRLRAAYDAVFDDFDAVLMPTTDGPAPALPSEDASPEIVLARSSEGVGNTGSFDLTGHPAISVPCGTVDGLPVGAMLATRHWHEATLYRIAEALEASVGE
jgi:amidase